MSEMVERVARALRAGRGCDAGEVPCPFCYWGPDDMTPEWDETGCVWLARAAIQAMREPTEGMLKATHGSIPRAFENIPEGHPWREKGWLQGAKAGAEAKALIRWQAMLDAALTSD